MEIKENFKRFIAGTLSLTTLTMFQPIIPVYAEQESEEFKYTMFASSNEEGAITVNANNFTINGQIATNGTVNCTGNTNINYENSNNICVDMVYILNKIDSDFFGGRKVDCIENDYNIEKTNIDISSPLSVNGITTMQGNVTVQAGIKSKDDICISGDVKNSYNTVIYSQYGDINIDCNNVSLNGLIYAPFGTIHITASNLNMNDTMIIANKIIIDAPNVNVNYSEHFGAYFNEISDKMEIPEEDFCYLEDLNNNNIPDFFENSINWKYIDDTDGDGIPDIIEISMGTDPEMPDSDINDILDNYTLEMMYKNPLLIWNNESSSLNLYGDLNSDYIIDAFDLVLMRQMVINNNYSKYADLDADDDVDEEDLKWLSNYLLGKVKSFPVYNQFDSDKDGLSDYIEVQFAGSSPNKVDTDGDGLTDFEEVMYTFTDPAKRESVENGLPDADADSDNDGISNIDELKLGSSPSSEDTDMDGLDDGYEVNILKTNPIKDDTDGDGITDYEEIELGLDPLNIATNGTPDGERIIKQTIPVDDPVFRDINTPDNAYALSVEINASGYAKNHLVVRDSSYAYALQDSSAVGFTPEFIYDDDYKVESITLKFEIKEEFRDNVSHYFDALNSGSDYYDYTYEIDPNLDGIKRFNVFKYFQSINLPMPICTEYDVDNNIVSVIVDKFEIDDDGNSYGIGSYSLVDIEVWGMLMNEDDADIVSTVSNTQQSARSASYVSSNKIKKSINKISDSVCDTISKNYQSYDVRKLAKTGESLGTGTSSMSSLFGHRYAYYEAAGISYSDAAAACRKKGGHLLTVTSPFEYSYLSGVLSSGKSGLYWVGASGGPNHWSWVTGESTSYARTISAYGYTMDSCRSYFSGLGNHLAYCPGLAYSISNYPKVSNIKGYICEWEPGAKITDTDAGIFSASIAGSTVVLLKAALSASSNIDSDNDGIPDWKEIDHKAIEKLGGKDSDVSVAWKNVQKYVNNVQKLAGDKTEELAKKIALVHDGTKEVTPTETNPGDDDSDGDGYKDYEDLHPNYSDIVVTKLSRDYIMVDYSTAGLSERLEDGWKNSMAEPGMENISYGGYQGWFRGLTSRLPRNDVREHFASQGCGLIAMTDLSLYLARRDFDRFGNNSNKFVSDGNPIDFNKYMDYIFHFNRLYVNFHNPLPASGAPINNIDGFMGVKLNNYFKDNNINYKASMGMRDDIWDDRIHNLISKDIPAIIYVGPTFDDDNIKLYGRDDSNIYKKSTYTEYDTVKNHYFTVTAVIEDKIKKRKGDYCSVIYEVSSWGKKYYMSEKEMSDYIKMHTPLFTNVIYITET